MPEFPGIKARNGLSVPEGRTDFAPSDDRIASYF